MSALFHSVSKQIIAQCKLYNLNKATNIEETSR